MKRTTSNEQTFSSKEQLVSTTDLQGRITYANPAFCQISGFSLSELIGQHHNIVRNPNIPKAAFEDLWRKLKLGDSWRGMVKNRCKNGDYYWVDAYVTPLYENNKVVGYQSVRTKPSREQINQAQAFYDQLNQGKTARDFHGNTPLKRLLATMLVVSALIAHSLIDTMFMASVVLGVTLLCLLAIFFEELIVFPREAKRVKGRFDSPSRFIYAGKGLTSIMTYPTKLYQARISTVLGRSKDSGEGLVKLANELEQLSSDMLGGIQEENAHLAQFATAITQMSATINEVSGNTTQTHDQVVNIQSECQQNIEVVETNKTKITQLASDVENAANSAIDLVQDVDKISVIMAEIQGIADQTNLIALNAAIEAARAGDQGRGFAVVADEVRTLALRTQEATGEIQSIIEKLQQGADKSVMAMNQGVEKAQHGVDQAKMVATAFSEVTNDVSYIVSGTEQISSAVEQQQALVYNINKNTNDIAVGADSILQASKNTSQATESLLQLADDLSEQLSQFSFKQ